MKKNAFRVGIFDSGIGGLTVLDECRRRLPCLQYYYYGDNQRAPYGGRSEEEILSFTKEALDYFVKIRADAVVLACNTATAAAVSELRRMYALPIIGMEPAVKPAAQSCKKVLVIATQRTIESARLKVLVERFPGCEFTLAACPHLAFAIEKYYTEGESFLLSAHLPEGKFDGVVLGCSHYSFFARQIARYYSAPTFDGNAGTAKRLKTVLERKGSVSLAHQESTQKQNICFSFKGKGGVKFVGKSRKINKQIYFRTFVLGKTKKK